MTNSDLNDSIININALTKSATNNPYLTELYLSHLQFLLAEQKRRITEQNGFTPPQCASGNCPPATIRPHKNAQYRYFGPDCVLYSDNYGNPEWRVIFNGSLCDYRYNNEQGAIDYLQALQSKSTTNVYTPTILPDPPKQQRVCVAVCFNKATHPYTGYNSNRPIVSVFNNIDSCHTYLESMRKNKDIVGFAYNVLLS